MMELHYSYEDIEPYEDYEDPEGSMLAHRQQLGLPPPIPLAEPWELGPPVLIGDEPSWHPPPAMPAYEVAVGVDDPGMVEDEVANMIAADWYENLEGVVRAELEDRREVGTDEPAVWDEFMVPGPFAHIDPALYRLETAASAGTAVEAWMTAQPLADRDPSAALVRDRAEERLRVVAPEQMAAYDQLRSGSRQAPLEAMRTVAPTIQRGDTGSGSAPPAAGSPPVRTTSPVGGAGPQPGPLGPWTSLSSETGPSVVASADSPAVSPSRPLEI